MSYWKLSEYSKLVSCESGDVLLYNSFMGAVARVPTEQADKVRRCGREGIAESDPADPVLKELCSGGFFVPAEFVEREICNDILDKERTATFRIIILPHENCNFRCLYCYEKFERGRMLPEVVQGLKELVRSMGPEYGGISVSWFGGEPLLARDIISELSGSFIESCQQGNIPYTSSITSNGYLLTDDSVTALLADGVKHFQVTLDGPREIHDNHRHLADGTGTYLKILGNLVRMRNREEDFEVRIRVNFTNASTGKIAEWISGEMAPLFAGDKRFALRFHPVGRWGGKNDAQLDVCDMLTGSQTKHEFLKKTAGLNFSDQIAREYLRPHGSVCYAAKESSIVVGSDGTLYKCTVALDDSRNRVGKLTGDGRLHLDMDLWNPWVKAGDRNNSRCGSCFFYPPCQGRSCPLAAMNRKTPQCPVKDEEIENLVRIVASAAPSGGTD